jgi:hypothetical protein
LEGLVGRRAKLANAPTIPQLARDSGVPVRTMARWVMRLAARDTAEECKHPWLYREGRVWRVNVEMMRKAHPERFAPAASAL